MTPARGGDAPSAPGRVWRICDRATFVELRRHGRHCRSGLLDVVWVAGSDDRPPRVAYAVGRQVGSAVVRNRVRRRLRVAAAELAATGALAPGDYLVVVSPKGGSASLDTLRSGLSTASARVAGRAA